MENKCRCDDLVELVMDTQNVIADMPTEKVRMLLIELDMIMDDYSRDLTIAYFCSNYSSKKHLCTTVLKGKHDHEIRATADDVKVILKNELAKRKSGA